MISNPRFLDLNISHGNQTNSQLVSLILQEDSTHSWGGTPGCQLDEVSFMATHPPNTNVPTETLPWPIMAWSATFPAFPVEIMAQIRLPYWNVQRKEFPSEYAKSYFIQDLSSWSRRYLKLSWIRHMFWNFSSNMSSWSLPKQDKHGWPWKSSTFRKWSDHSSLGGQLNGVFHRHGATPIAGWFLF